MTPRPKVSVCIPTFNRAGYLKESIQSVLNQTFTDFELVIVDNASEDKTRETVHSFKDKRIRYYRNSENIGLIRNWNRCIELAGGKYITILCDDDLMLPENLAKKVKVLESENVDIVFCSMNVIDDKGNQLYVYNPYSESKYLPGRAKIIECLSNGNCIGCPSLVTVRAITFKKAGKFNETLSVHADQEMWLRVLLNGDAFFLAEPLVSLRRHSGSDSSRLQQAGQMLSLNEKLKFLLCYYQNEQIHTLLNDHRKVKQFTLWLLGWFNYQLQNLKEARKWLIQTMLIRPFNGYSFKAFILLLISFLGKDVSKKIMVLYDSFLNPLARSLRNRSRYLRGKIAAPTKQRSSSCCCRN